MAYLQQIDSHAFYEEYYGHKIKDLHILKTNLQKLNPYKFFIYFAGDSSLDNKYWVKGDEREAVNGYDKILQPASMLPDVSYHLNKLLENSNYYVINSAIEESTIADRETSLLPHDMFVRDNITNDDILIVSVGGNDIALKPSLNTIFNAAKLVYMNNLSKIRSDPTQTWGMNYFIKMFKNDVENYIKTLIGNNKPRKIIICMIYYPDEKKSNSWADKSLGALGYNSNPGKLQEIIKQIFIHATMQIHIPECNIIPFPMYSVMDGKNQQDYIERCEPSAIGGRKLAIEFAKLILS
jgi:hypothetical protein